MLMLSELTKVISTSFNLYLDMASKGIKAHLQATLHDIRFRSILSRKRTLVCKESLYTEALFHSKP